MLNSFQSIGNQIISNKSSSEPILPGQLLLYYPLTFSADNYATGSAVSASGLTSYGTTKIVMNNTYYRICCDILQNSGYLSIPSTNVLNDPVLGYGISVSLWFNILSDSNPTVNTDRILSFDGGIIEVYISSVNGTAPNITSFTITITTPNNTFTSSTLNTNTFHHLVITDNFSNLSGKICINNSKVYTNDLQLTSTTLSSSYIGRVYTGSSLNTMHMQIFGFRLYNRALSLPEINTLYTAEYPSGTVASTNLILHYPSIDNSFNITPSSSTNLITTGTPTIVKNNTAQRYASNFPTGTSYYTLPNFTLANGGRTISIWFNMLDDLKPNVNSSGNPNDRVICWDGSNGARFFLRINGTYSNPPIANWSFSFNDTDYTKNNLATNTFHHIVVLYDTNIGSSRGGLYINNTVIANLDSASIGSLNIPSKTYTTARIGKSSFADPNNSCHTQWFDYRIYNRRLSAAEISKLYTDVSNNLYLNKHNIINIS